MVAAHLDDRAPRPGGGIPNGSLAPCTTSTGTRTASSSASRLDSGRPGGWSGKARQSTPTAPVVSGGSACDTRAGRAAARDERQPGELVPAQMVEDRDPRCVELMRGRGRAASGDAVRLLDERNGEALFERDVLRRDEIWRRDASARAVPEHERAARRLRVVQVHARRSVRCLDHERRQCQMIFVARVGLMHANANRREE